MILLPGSVRTLEAGPDNSPGFWLHHAALAWTALIEDRLAPLNLTQPQFMVLSVIGWLSRSGEIPNQQDVANKAGIDRMLTSRLIHRLEEAGHVTRQGDPTDSRVIRVSLTEKGRSTAAQAVQLVRDIDETVFDDQPVKLRDELRQIAQVCRERR